MPKKQKPDENSVILYDVAANASRRERASAVKHKYSTKTTLNLCMREKPAVSVELFFLLLAIILIFLLLIEFFGIYRPYYQVEQLEKTLDADRSAIAELQRKLDDYDEKREEYNKYNYEDYDATLADRLDVLDMLERVVTPYRAKIRSLSFDGRNTLSMSLTDIDLQNVSKLSADLLMEKDLVAEAVFTMTNYVDEGTGEKVPAANFVLTLKGGN